MSAVNKNKNENLIFVYDKIYAIFLNVTNGCY